MKVRTRIGFGCPMRSYLHSFGRRYPHGSWFFSRSANAASTLWSKLAADNQRFGMIDRLAALIADPRVPARAAPVWLSVKAREFDRTVGKLRGDMQFTAHCRDQVTKSADPHVAAAGQL